MDSVPAVCLVVGNLKEEATQSRKRLQEAVLQQLQVGIQPTREQYCQSSRLLWAADGQASKLPAPPV